MDKLTAHDIAQFEHAAHAGLTVCTGDQMLELCRLALQALGAGWQPIETAPKDKTNILIGWWDGETYWDETRNEQRFKDPDKLIWASCISSYEDHEYRRGFNHRNGPWKATLWQPLPSAPSD